MSECVVRMPYPKDCESCHLKTRNFFTGDFICAKTHTFLPASGKNNNCPIICQLPEGHGRLVDADELKAKQQEDADLFINAYTLMEKSRRDEALNAVANIVNATTIVPAEAERRET